MGVPPPGLSGLEPGLPGPKSGLSGPKSGLSGPKSALSGLISALSGLKSPFSDLKSAHSLLKPALSDLKSALSDLKSVLSALRTNGRMNESPPVFYRTSSPLGPLPCFLSLKFTIMQSRAKGIADHILPLGNWLFAYIPCGLCLKLKKGVGQ